MQNGNIFAVKEGGSHPEAQTMFDFDLNRLYR